MDATYARPGERAVPTRFLTAEEAADYLGLSVKTVLRAYRGEGPYRARPLPGYKPSRKVLRFTLEDIDRWLRSAVAPRAPEPYAGTGRQRARRVA
ncbi:MAG: helix-turn-helix domain-containing protein [Actinomycetales bacterium]|nr:helix-turn-helix domain-containing protein [Actinomycetales bacterium]